MLYIRNCSPLIAEKATASRRIVPLPLFRLPSISNTGFHPVVGVFPNR